MVTETTPNTSPSSDAEHIRVERRGAAAVVTLDRPAALNALSIDMRAKLIQAVSGFGRDPQLYVVILKSAAARTFSVGGDVREMTGLAIHDLAAARRGLAEELRLCWLMECLSKPVVSFIDGRVMGTGAGISLYNTHRVAGENYRFAMPETQIGYFPDCGVAHAFARMPRALGLYLGLTGREIGAPDAYALGLVTHCIPAARYSAIEERFADADPIDPILDGAHVEPGYPPLMAESEWIERVFGAPSLAEIVGRLETAPGSGAGAEQEAEFRARTLAQLRQRSPTALAVTDRMIRNARDMDIREALIQDYRLAHRFAALPDFHEGVRAVLIEKDGKPKWNPARIEDVPPSLVDAFLAPLGQAELALPTRAEMQERRV